jgi:hypothetical protein
MNTNLFLTLLLQLWATQPTNTLPPVAFALPPVTNTIVFTNSMLTGSVRIEDGVRQFEWIDSAIGTNVERQRITAVIYFRTNPTPMSSSLVMLDTNAPRSWHTNPPPLPGFQPPPMPGQFSRQ